MDVTVNRVLPASPYQSLADYVAAGGGAGLTAALAVAPDVVIGELEASGLRGRGGAGFPTGVKWRTVASYASPLASTTVVVNAAEGEPGTFKDRAIIDANPYAVLEGALIAAHAVGATTIVVATKARFTAQVARLRAAVTELREAGLVEGIELRLVEGPAEYLFGEETALLEVIDGRAPFPRIAPPFRRGVDEVPVTESDPIGASGLSAPVQMAETDAGSDAPPTLVDNVETMANVPAIIARGADWFRSLGTPSSPGTLVCTVTGAVRRPGVGEVPMGTSLRDVIDTIGGGLVPDRSLRAVLVGVSSAVITPDKLDTALTYEAMAAIGSGLGSGGYVVVGDDASPVGIAAGISRFLAVESCGQCTPCKQDGGEIATLLDDLAKGTGQGDHLARIDNRLATVADGARCSLGRQHQTVVTSVIAAFRSDFEARQGATAEPVDVLLMAELVALDDGGAHLDESFAGKQPDWTYDAEDSGKTPVERLTDHRADEPVIGTA